VTLDLADRLRQHVDRLAGLIGPRHLERPAAWDATVALIDREFAGYGYAVTHHAYRVRDREVANLVAEIPGGADVVIVGAHYDTVPETPGADDNASGVAMLLEVARLLRPLKPRRTIRFVAFPCEEPPHFYTRDMGSQKYARLCRGRNEHVKAMLSLEMVGYYTSDPQELPPEIPGLLRWAVPRHGRFVAAVGNLASARLVWTFRRGFKGATRFPLYSIALPESVHAIRLSDNSSFWDQGYPALMITDTSFLRNPHYHLPSDLPETLDYAAMASVTAGVAGAVAHLGRADVPRGFPR
jgi:Zn-dependent M28 family amino/carboxypeptidase